MKPKNGPRGRMALGIPLALIVSSSAVPAALAGGDLAGPCKTGGLVDRILRAANPN